MRLLVPLALATAVLPACITEDIRIAPPANTPPTISTPATADHPLSEIIQLSPTITDGGVGELVAPRLDVVIRDPDVDQALIYEIFVDERDVAPMPSERVPATGEVDREVTITVPLAPRLMTDGCHRIELFVSSGFECLGTCTPVPIDDGDLGTAVWWVATRNDPEDTTPIDMTGCPR